MKNKIMTRLSLIMLLMSAVALQSAYAQSMEWEEIPDGTEVLNLSGFETGKYILTESIKASIRELVEGPAGFKAQCADGKVVKVKGYSDPQKYEGVPEEISDLLNDQLASQRTQRAIRYATDELDMNQHCFSSTEPKYADSKIRGVGFAVVERSGGSWLYQRLNSHTDSTNKILDEIHQDITDIESEISEIKKKNAEQDSILNVHDGRITDNADDNERQDGRISSNEERIAALEKRSWNVSKYIGVGLNRFVDQYSFSSMAAIQVRSVELSAWYSYNSDTGTETIGEDMEGFVPETIDLRRETYGAGLTWFGIQKNRYALGLMVKFEHGEDIEQGVESNIRKWDMVSAGLQAELKIYKSLHMRANVSHSVWNRLSTFDNPEYRTNASPISGMVTIGLRFN